LTLPWASLIGAIEGAATRDVAILQLQPDAEHSVLRLTAEARNRDAMFEYLKRLGAARELTNVVLVSHQVQKDEPQQPIQFSGQALLGWEPASKCCCAASVPPGSWRSACSSPPAPSMSTRWCRRRRRRPRKAPRSSACAAARHTGRSRSTAARRSCGASICSFRRPTS